MHRAPSLLAVALVLSACASRPEAARPEVTRPSAVPFALQAARFGDLPGWERADLAPALLAFRRACDSRRQRDPSAGLPGGGRYGGTVSDWAPACTAVLTVSPGAERAFFESYFIPYFVRGEGEARLTAYYEPV